jgi:hypothetical protein
MAFLALLPWKQIGYFAIVACFVFAAYLAFERMADHYRDEGAHSRDAEVAGLKTSIATTQARATQLALLWADQVQKVEAPAIKQEETHAQEFAQLQNDARLAASHSPAHFSGISIGVFDRARSAASGAASRSPSQPQEAPAANPASAEEFVVSLYDWIGVCKARVDEWEQFYAGLQLASKGIQ